MRSATLVLVVVMSVLLNPVASGQGSRIPYNQQQLFLSGANLAWMNYAGDIGPGLADTTMFGDVLLQFHDHGGNAVRWWLHINGTETPQFDGTGHVSGPGVNSVANLQHALDIAWQRGVGVVLSLWSFDMLNKTFADSIKSRNKNLLTDTAYTNAYINNSLIPMVKAVKGHPAIIAWEIFNEPEGMSNEYGWSDYDHVSMAIVQRVVNMCAGAIHRTDSTAVVTNGTCYIQALTDVPVASVKPKGGPVVPVNSIQRESAAALAKAHYNLQMSIPDIIKLQDRIAGLPNHNYYSDAGLVAAGGDSLGKLDVYEDHWYYFNDHTTNASPFNHACSAWSLTKPLVIGEFSLGDSASVGMSATKMYDTLYKSGYAGALAWSWTDSKFSQQSDMLNGMQYMATEYPADVAINGIAGVWPTITISSPAKDTAYVDTTAIHLSASVVVAGSTVTWVKFYINDTTLVGTATNAPYLITWTNVATGLYNLTARVLDSKGHSRTSSVIRITVGLPPMTRLEAEAAVRSGTGITVKSDPTASGGSYVDMAAQTGTITWTIPHVPVAATYPVSIGFKLNYQSPKSQYINVNGVRADTIAFEAGSGTTWYTKTFPVALQPGSNTVQMELAWGWMSVDFLSVPTTLVTTSVSHSPTAPTSFALYQNYPNPFNPTTDIRYRVSDIRYLNLSVYDVLGREVATLVNEVKSPGTYTVRFDGGRLASGVYVYRLSAGTFTQVKAMLLVK